LYYLKQLKHLNNKENEKKFIILNILREFVFRENHPWITLGKSPLDYPWKITLGHGKLNDIKVIRA